MYAEIARLRDEGWTLSAISRATGLPASALRVREDQSCRTCRAGMTETLRALTGPAPATRCLRGTPLTLRARLVRAVHGVRGARETACILGVSVETVRELYDGGGPELSEAQVAALERAIIEQRRRPGRTIWRDPPARATDHVWGIRWEQV
jgi:hypothetical protein